MAAPQILVTASSDETPPPLDRGSWEDGSGILGPSAVALEPLEKEWLQGAASAHVPTLSHLLQQDPALATKKDFTSGFTALHWAAKHGKEDLVALLLDAGADVNVRAHGGYTPLHIAALHGHRRLVERLIWTYGAKQNIRDYSGRLARHYLRVEPSEGAPRAPQLGPLRSPRRNRKLACLLLPKNSGHQAWRRWGSASDLVEDQEEEEQQQQQPPPPRGGPYHLAPPPAYRARKFSR